MRGRGRYVGGAEAGRAEEPAGVGGKRWPGEGRPPWPPASKGSRWVRAGKCLTGGSATRGEVLLVDHQALMGTAAEA
ncbi:hypothetical protein ADL02_22425, partial [Streptomyces sp. NRRL WC-3723]